MTGQQLYDDVLTPTLSTESIDQNYALVLFNLARVDFEDRRPLQVLKALDVSQTAQAGSNLTTPIPIPSPATPSLTSPYLMSYLLEGSIQLVNPTNPQDVIELKEVAMEQRYNYQGGNYFWVDYVARELYILANLPHAYTVSQFFIADFGDITLSTVWNGIMPRFHAMLAFQAAARYRLGADYDDIAARNADENYKSSEDLYRALMQLDSRISQQQTGNRDPSRHYHGGGRQIGIGMNNSEGYA